MEECRQVAEFFNRVLRQQTFESQKRLYFMKTQIRLINERNYEDIRSLQSCFSNALQSLAQINNLTVHVPTDGITSIPLIAKLEASNAALRMDLEFCSQENARLNYVIDWLLASKTACKQFPLQLSAFVQYQEIESDIASVCNVSALTSRHYQEIISKLQERLRRFYQDNQALSSMFIKSEKQGAQVEISNRKLKQYLQELKMQLVGIKSAVQAYVQDIQESLQSERNAKNELERNSKFITERLFRQIYENDAIKSDLESFTYNQRVKTGMLIKVALKQREGEYAGLCAEFKTHADECKQLANLQNTQMMMKEDLVVELRLKLIEMFKRRDFHKEQFRKQFEEEFVPKIVKLQDENGKLRESLSVGQDESLKLTEKVEFLENVKRLLTASNISLSYTNEQLEEQSKQISQQFINQTLTNDVLRRRIDASLLQVQQVSSDRDAMIKYNDELISRYACAAQRYSDIIKAYYVMVVDLAQTSGRDQKDAVKLANSVYGMAHYLISSPLGYRIDKYLYEISIDVFQSTRFGFLRAGTENQERKQTDLRLISSRSVSAYNRMNTPYSKDTDALLYSIAVDGFDAQQQYCNGKEVFYRRHAPIFNTLDALQQEFREQQPQQAEKQADDNERLPLCDSPNSYVGLLGEKLLPEAFKLVSVAQNAVGSISTRVNEGDKAVISKKPSLPGYYQSLLLDRAEISAAGFSAALDELSSTQSMSYMTVTVADKAVQVDAMESEMIQAAGENRRRAEKKYTGALLTQSNPAANSLHYRTLHCQKMMHDAELLTLPVQTQVELFRRFISEDAKSELSNSETQTETQKEVNGSEPYLYRSLTFSAIPRNSFSRACLTMLPNISRAIEEVNETPQRLTIKELLELDVVNYNDELLMSTYSYIGSEITGTYLEHDYETPPSLTFYQQTDELLAGHFGTCQVVDKTVQTDAAQYERYLLAAASQAREIDQLEGYIKHYRAEAERYYTEAHMLAFDLLQRTKELSYLRTRHAKLSEIQLQSDDYQCKRSKYQVQTEQEQLGKQIYAKAYRELEARYRGCEQAFANVLYLAGYLEKNNVNYEALLVLDKIQRFGTRLYLLDVKMQEAMTLTHKRNEQVQSLLQVLRQYAYFGDPKVRDLFENKEMAYALLRLYENDEQVIKNAYLQRPTAADAATQTSLEQKERYLRSSPQIEYTTDGCEFNLVRLGCNLKCRPATTLGGGHDYCLQSAPPYRSKSIYVSSMDRRLSEKDKLISYLLYQTYIRSKELETKGVLLRSSREKCQQLMEQMQMLNRFFNETPRDYDYEKIAGLSQLLLFQQQEILALQQANANLEKQRSEAEKAIRFMFGDVEYEKSFSGCLFRPSTMCKATNYSYTRRRGKNE